MCVAGKYKQALGSVGCAACPTDHFAPAQSTMESACYPAPKVVFVLTMGGDISVSDLTEKVQAQMLDNIAKSLKMDSSLLKIVTITNAMRRLLAVNVNVQAMVQDDAAASAVAGLAQAVAAAATSGASDAGFNVTVTSSPIIVPAPLPIVSTPPAPPPSSTNVLSPPPKGPFPVTTNVPVAVNLPPSEKSDKGTSKKGTIKTGIIAACITSAVLFFIVTGILLYRWHAKRKHTAKSEGIVPSFLGQQLVTTSAAERSQPWLSTDAWQDMTLEDSAAGVQALYPQDQPPVNCRINERPLAQACGESSPVSQHQSTKLVALKTPAPQALYLSPLLRENNSAYADCDDAGMFTISTDTEAAAQHTEVLQRTIAGLEDEAPASSNADKETILPAPSAAILSDAAPVSSGSSENVVENLFQKAIVHTSQEIGDLTDGLSASDKIVFQSALEFAVPATVENRCQDSLRFSALDASVVLLRMLLEFCAAYRFLLPCACGFDGR
jgi:hypothetical protein